MVTEHDRLAVRERLNPVSAIRVYANLPEHLQSDQEIAKATFAIDGLAIVYAPLLIQLDPECRKIAGRDESARNFLKSISRKDERAA